jgi:iron complex outermembrane receptor protein
MLRTLSLPYISFTLLASFNTLVSASQAEQQISSALEEEIQWLQEETYVSTATKTLEHINKSGASVSIITEKDLKLSGARNLMDALKQVPGINVQTTNIGIPAVSVRGVKTDSSEKVLFMINGHSINNNLVNGGATWAYRNFQVDEIKRVEIVRGPGSALYGTNAFVAIINIVTKTAQDLNKSTVSLGLATNRTKRLNVSTSDKSENWNYAVNINAFDTDGISEEVDQDGFGNSGQSYDWEERYDIGFNGQIHDLTLNAKLIQRKAGPYIGIASVLNDESKQDYLEYFVEATYQKPVNENLEITAKTYFDHFEANNYWEIYPEGFPGFGAGSFPEGFIGSPTVKNRKFGGELQALIKLLNGNKILGGISFEKQTQFDVKHHTNFNPNTGAALDSYQDVSDTLNWNSSNDRDITAAYLQNIWDVDEDLRLIVGARHDHYSDFGDSFSPRSSLSWHINQSATLTLLYGQAFRAPNFGELYNINTPVIKGNENLDAEEIETFEASIDFQINKRQSAKVTTFKNNINNIIGYVGGTASNNGKLETKGIELEYTSRLQSGSSFGANYTYQYPENEATSSRAPDIPLHQINANYTYRYSRHLSAYLGSQYRSSLGRKSGDSRAEVSAQTTVDLAVNWRSEKDTVAIKASIYNVFDETNYDAAVDSTPALTVQSDFPTDGRSFALTGTLAL